MTEQEMRTLAMKAALTNQVHLGGVLSEAKLVYQWLRDGGTPGEYVFSPRMMEVEFKLPPISVDDMTEIALKNGLHDIGWVLDKIRATAKRGEFMYICASELPGSVTETLTKLGFTVDHHERMVLSHGQTPKYHIISWMPEVKDGEAVTPSR